MICPFCGEETEGRNHNNRGLRCTFCWYPLTVALVPAPVVDIEELPEWPASDVLIEEIGLWPAVVDKLRDAGYSTGDAIRMVSDEDLLALHGIGKRTVEKLRRYFGKEEYV